MGQRRRFIGALARETGVSIQTIRYYERMGLLPRPQRIGSGYRVYGPEAVDRLVFVRKAQSLGLQLRDVRAILDLVDRGRCPCGHVQGLLKTRLSALREKMAAMRTLERRLKDATARGCPPNFRPRGQAICPTIERQRISKGRQP